MHNHLPLLFHPFLQHTHYQYIFLTFDLIAQQPIHLFFTMFPMTHWPNTDLVAMVHTFYRHDWEPSRVSAIVIHHVSGPNPLQLVALVHIELGQCGLVPPIPLCPTAAAILGTFGSSHRRWDLTSINFKTRVGGKERCMRPVRLDPTPLCGPVICVPNWAVHTHGLVLREWYSFVFHVRLNSYWCIVH